MGRLVSCRIFSWGPLYARPTGTPGAPLFSKATSIARSCSPTIAYLGTLMRRDQGAGCRSDACGWGIPRMACTGNSMWGRGPVLAVCDSSYAAASFTPRCCTHAAVTGGTFAASAPQSGPRTHTGACESRVPPRRRLVVPSRSPCRSAPGGLVDRIGAHRLS
eukprot:scaffold7976_cov403-Prasinococcus_capsulatus_cf.AAC.11